MVTTTASFMVRTIRKHGSHIVRLLTLRKPRSDQFVGEASLTVLKVENSFTSRNTGRAIVACAVLHAAFLVGSLAVIPILAPGARIPNPFGSDDAARTFLLNGAEAIRVSSFLQLMSAVCLAAFGAMMTQAQKLSKDDSASSLTLAGAIGAAVLLAISALCSWALASPGAVDPGPAFRTLQFLPFLMGGPGWAGFFGLFLAGIVRSGGVFLPKWIVWTGWFLSATSALAMFVMLTISASVCLPISRFLGFLWLIFVAIQWNGKLSLPEKAPTT